MKKSVDEKRWAILPPPSSSTEVAGAIPRDSHLDLAAAQHLTKEQLSHSPQREELEAGGRRIRKEPARRSVSELRVRLQTEDEAFPEGLLLELTPVEPADSERITEIPTSFEPFTDALETIPAPTWPDADRD